MTATTSIVIFGASGDLTHRKLIPALYNNYIKGRLPENTQIIGFSRTEYSHEEFRAYLLDGVTQNSSETFALKKWQEFCKNIFYIAGNFNVDEDFDTLNTFLAEKETAKNNRLYYLATAPRFFSVITDELDKHGMATQTEDRANWRRLIIEKPFGTDLATAQALNHDIHAAFTEDQIYRIDHYLGKETSQNIMFFRFANTIFEPLWNRQYISNVQITVTESIDIGDRGGYYDSAGVLRDMFQNHLFQLLSLIAMEAPASFEADAIRNEKVKVFQSTRPLKLEDVVFGQYEGYRETEEVAEDSTTPTYAALKLFVDNWRWQGVPFYLRSGKNLKRKTSEIIIEFQPPPHYMFDLPEGKSFSPNFLSLCLQPDEGIHLRFEAKQPDTDEITQSVNMEFHYDEGFTGVILPEAYERLLLEALEGDASLFTRSDGIEAAWALIDPIIKSWEGNPDANIDLYSPDSWGPERANALLAETGHRWRLGCAHPPDEIMVTGTVKPPKKS